MLNGDYILVVAPPDYPGKRYRGKYCYAHRLAWWRKTGEAPASRLIIHHIDGNKHNNSAENLGIMSPSQHNLEHALAKTVPMVRFTCPGCGGTSERPKRNVYGKRVLCCSRRCIGKTFYPGAPYAPDTVWVEFSVPAGDTVAKEWK